MPPALINFAQVQSESELRHRLHDFFKSRKIDAFFGQIHEKNSLISNSITEQFMH